MPASTVTVLPIIERWAGLIEVGDETDGVVGLAIRDDDAYDALIARLPARRVQMKQPAPKSTDPLRARPAIDFATRMLVVVTRSQSLGRPTIARISAVGRRVVVHYAMPPMTPEARPHGIGAYAAALVARKPGALELQGPRVIDDRAALAGALGELVTVRGSLSRTRMPSILGVDVDEGSADGEQPAEATGWLERDEVDQAELERHIALHGQVANRGGGTFLRLLAPEGAGLAPARRYSPS